MVSTTTMDIVDGYLVVTNVPAQTMYIVVLTLIMVLVAVKFIKTQL